ncbi:hypothetical protein [Clostridium aminobutyricum]|uniref:Lipoprotein n=1 Tax=Clostridium aminobutyricum TaxID=33953 RepID=A0A939D691_CLOAM|nr:hypothetical protein [Clostridium aminobutyricum]MBN7772189.1 hypothetical protein [Clostridium aminobutyricum]
MGKKLSAIVLAVVILLGISSCSMQEQGMNSTDSTEINLKQIRQGIGQFSKLKNGTLEVDAMMRSENHAVESLNNEMTKNTSLITFILNRKGYDFLEERNALNEQTGKSEYSATKQVQGRLSLAIPVEQSIAERTKPYEWEDISGTNRNHYEPNGALSMMAVPSKIVDNEKYIASITKEKEGSLTKYTLTTSETFAKYAKEIHREEENYTVREHREIYWINGDGLLIKRQIYEKFDWTMDGIEDTYSSNTTVELTGYNYKKLTKIGDELSPMIVFEGNLYTQSSAVLDINVDALIEIGTIESVVGSIQKPEKNNQANRLIKNAKVYKSGKNSLIVKYSDYTLYEKRLLEI